MPTKTLNIPRQAGPCIIWGKVAVSKCPWLIEGSGLDTLGVFRPSINMKHAFVIAEDWTRLGRNFAMYSNVKSRFNVQWAANFFDGKTQYIAEHHIPSMAITLGAILASTDVTDWMMYKQWFDEERV